MYSTGKRINNIVITSNGDSETAQGLGPGVKGMRDGQVERQIN